MSELEKIRKRFGEDAFATKAAGIVIEAAEPGYARCRMDIRPIHMNAAGTVMGGAIFTLADYAFAVAANIESMCAQSLTSTITYLSAPKGEYLTAEARQVKRGRSTCFYLIEITDSTGRNVASVSTSGFISAEK